MTDIAITTVSWIRTEEEHGVVLDTLRALSRLNVPIVVVDGGSPPESQQAMRAIPHVVFHSAGGGLTNQLVLSHQEAARLGQHLLYLQSDKLEFARHSAGMMIESYRKLPEKGMLIPVRTQESIESYPAYQWEVEKFLNFFVGDYIGISNDYYAGPSLYPAALVKYLAQMKGDIGWGIEAYLYAIAKRLGMPFHFIPATSMAPKDIDDAEKTRNYRLIITQWQIEGLLQGKCMPL